MQGCTGTGASCNIGGGGPGRGKDDRMYDPPPPPPVEPPPPPQPAFDYSNIQLPEGFDPMGIF